MEKVIKALKHEKLNVSVIIGGPNVSSSYAQKIGALGAARNAFEGLRLVKNKNRATR
jgi:methanogenic corrinoid protein MtbC1